MLQLHTIRSNKDEVIAKLKKKNFKNAEVIINSIVDLDEERRSKKTELEGLLAEGNLLAKQIGELFRSEKKEKADTLKIRSTEIKEKATRVEERFNQIEKEVQQLLLVIPNTPHPSVPLGITPEENEEIFAEGVMPKLDLSAIPHWELTSKYDIIDFELGNKITGAGFPVYKGKGARLQRALINFFLDEAVKAGYYEIMPPNMVNADSGFGTGQLPDKEGQMYHVTIDDLYLIPTAEVPITNLYRNMILKEEDLPVKNVGYTPCFRREAGSYGAHVRGLNRLHQFDKVEIVQLVHPDNSYKVLEEMVEHVKSLLRKLELPYRILRLCGGDMSFASALTYDFEVFSAAQQRWLEVSSTSNFETFQANRMKCRFKDKNGKNQLVHTLNGSALALPRIVAALLENNQTEEGIRIPTALHSYTGFEIIN